MFERINMLNEEEDREMHCNRDRPAVQDESSAERNEGKEKLCELRRGGWMGMGCCVTC